MGEPASEAALPLDWKDWPPAASSKKWKRRKTFPGVGPVKEKETPGRPVRQEGEHMIQCAPSMTGKRGPRESLSDTNSALPLTLAEQVT